MIVTRPRFEKIPLELKGKSWFRRVLLVWRTPPRLRLTEDWIITLDDGLQLVVPKGFITDLASVPRIFWLIPGFSPFGLLLEGSILHDFGYQHGYLLSPYCDFRRYPTKSLSLFLDYKSDLGGNIPVFVGYKQPFFDNIMAGICQKVTGAGFVPWLAKIVLHLFGHIAWNKYRGAGPGAFGMNSLDLFGLDSIGQPLLLET